MYSQSSGSGLLSGLPRELLLDNRDGEEVDERMYGFEISDTNHWKLCSFPTSRVSSSRKYRSALFITVQNRVLNWCDFTQRLGLGDAAEHAGYTATLTGRLSESRGPLHHGWHTGSGPGRPGRTAASPHFSLPTGTAASAQVIVTVTNSVHF